MTKIIADALFERGFFCLKELTKASIEDLLQVKGVENELFAQSLIENAIKGPDEIDETSDEDFPEDAPDNTDISDGLDDSNDPEIPDNGNSNPDNGNSNETDVETNPASAASSDDETDVETNPASAASSDEIDKPVTDKEN